MKAIEGSRGHQKRKENRDRGRKWWLEDNALLASCKILSGAPERYRGMAKE